MDIAVAGEWVIGRTNFISYRHLRVKRLHLINESADYMFQQFSIVIDAAVIRVPRT